MKKLNTSDFIKKSIEKHGNLYNYSLSEYINSSTKIRIICQYHGYFEQSPNNHLQGSKCPKCSNELRGKKSSRFIEKSIDIFGDLYDYSLVNYVNNKTKVKIICKHHGIFEQRPDAHIAGQRCHHCFGTSLKTTSEFIEQSNKIHNHKYNYSLVDYNGNGMKVNIICKDHGEFYQTPNKHLGGFGCPRCKKNYKMTTKDFIDKSIDTHGDLYDYSCVEYKNSHSYVQIKCVKHGDFIQTAYKHIQGRGCPKCKLSNGVSKICKILNSKNIKYELEKKLNGCVSRNGIPLRFDIYIPMLSIYIEYDGEQHFRSVEWWGGEDSFIETVDRDKRKNEFCDENSIQLIRISYKEDIVDRINALLLF